MQLQRRCQQSTKSLLRGNPYRFIDNGGDVLAVAHCDSVRCGSRHYQRRGNLVYSTALDDRIGVHIILDILPAMGVNVDVLLTDDEEIGQSTAQLFKANKQYNWMFQFDRRGTDAVVYHYAEMEPFVSKHFDLGQGTFSDICWLDLDCGGVNIGTGYYNEHTLDSFADLAETKRQICAFQRFYNEFSDVHILEGQSDDNQLRIARSWNRAFPVFPRFW